MNHSFIGNYIPTNPMGIRHENYTSSIHLLKGEEVGD